MLRLVTLLSPTRVSSRLNPRWSGRPWNCRQSTRGPSAPEDEDPERTTSEIAIDVTIHLRRAMAHPPDPLPPDTKSSRPGPTTGLTRGREGGMARADGPDRRRT